MFVPIQGYASVFHVLDDQRDRIRPGAFKQTLASPKKRIKMLWQHDPHQPIGWWDSLIEDPKGLYAQGFLMLDLPRGREAWALVRHHVLDGLSIGFQVQKATRCPQTGIRTLHQVRLIEISLVTFAAAHPQTTLQYAAPIRDPTQTSFPHRIPSHDFVNQVHDLARILTLPHSSSLKPLKKKD